MCVYTPNSQDQLRRLDYRMAWEDAFLHYINGLRASKPVVFCGDLNVAHREIDIYTHTEKHSYGPQQAVLIPYVELTIEQ